MIDIDFFKKVNDELGHPIGDKVLIEISALMVETFRKSDVVSRYGGEEFIICFKETNLESAKLSLERFLIKLRNLRILEVPWGITCSAGLVKFSNEVDCINLVTKADKRMYLSKQLGRDRLSI